MKALIVGYGRMGRFHARVLADLGYEIVTVDPHAWAGFPTITKAHMAGHTFDVAAVATPADRLAKIGLALGGTPMLIEKPFASSLWEAEMLAEYLEMRGAPVCVGFVERFNPKVRWLREQIRHAERIGRATFTRYSDRASESPLDLLSHDVDLARHLGFNPLDVEYDHRHEQPQKVRHIEVEINDRTVWVDLMAHDLSPLHALWHAFLSGGEYPKPKDALAVFRTVEMMQLAKVAT